MPLTSDEVQGIIEQNRQLTARVKELEAIIADYNAQSAFTYCVYCGERFPVDGDKSSDAITNHVETCEKHPVARYKNCIDILEQRLDDVESNREKLLKESYENIKRIATLEQQLGDANDENEILKRDYSEIRKIQEEECTGCEKMQQSEKRGYELASKKTGGICDGATYQCFTHEKYTYEQAVAERDGGEKKE